MKYLRIIFVITFISGSILFSCSKPSDDENEYLEEEEHLENKDHIEDNDSIEDKRM